MEQDPEAGDQASNEETAVGQEPTNSHPKRRRRILLGVAVTVLILIAITLAAVLTTDDPEPKPNHSYEELLKDVGLNSSSSDAQVEKALSALADEFMSSCQAGSSIAVTRNGTRIMAQRGVLAVDNPSNNVTQDTLFEIGSVSKPLTGLLLASLIVAGQVSLNTTLNSLLPDSIPDLIVNDELVTLRQLVTHTAGFPRLSKNVRESSYNDFRQPNPYAGFTEEDMLREISIASTELSQTGNSEYSNFGFSVLGYLLGKSQDTTFPALQKNLTNRLGMNDTWIEIPEEARENLSTGYNGLDEVPYWFDGGLFIDGAGSTVSSTRDLLTWIELLMSPNDENLQDQEMTEALQLSLESLKPLSDNEGLSFAWGYGGEPRFWSHGGSTAGFNSYVAFQPETSTGIVAISNCGDLFDVFTLGGALSSHLFVSYSEYR